MVEVTTIEECEEKFSRFENGKINDNYSILNLQNTAVEIGDTKICGRDTNGRPDGCVGNYDEVLS